MFVFTFQQKFFTNIQCELLFYSTPECIFNMGFRNSISNALQDPCVNVTDARGYSSKSAVHFVDSLVVDFSIAVLRYFSFVNFPPISVNNRINLQADLK